MAASLIIALRESLEAFLIVGILLAYLRQMGATQHAKWIYAGVILGLLAALLASVILRVVVDQFNAFSYQMYLNVVIMLTAAGVLTFMAVWMQKQAREATGASTELLRQHVDSGNIFGIVLIAFVSVLREGIETILFFSALVYSGGSVSIIGGLLGMAMAIFLVWLLMKVTKNVPIGPFFRWTSLLLIVIAAGLIASVVNILQGQGLLPGTHAPLFDTSNFLSDTSGIGHFMRGLFGYNATPTPLQFIVWMLYLAVAILLWMRAYSPTRIAKPA